ncbi:hypothetical protein Tco_0533608 [Tanacetum coccineum]
MSYGRRTRTLEEEGFDGRKKNPKKEEEKMENVEQGTAVMKKLVEKLGNAEDKAECKKLKKELEEARFSNTFLRMQNERVERDLYWTRVRAHELYQEMIRRGFVFEERPNETIEKSCLQSMAPLIQAAIRRMIKESVDAAIRLREKTMKVDAYIRGLTDNIKGEVISSKSDNLNEANNQKQGNARAMITAPMMERCLLDHPPLCERCFTRHVGPLGEQGQLRNQMRQGRVKQEEVGEVRGRAYAIKDVEPQGSNVVLPLTKLTQKDKKYEWGKEEEEAFQTLKQKLCSAPILVLLRTEDLWILRCDT